MIPTMNAMGDVRSRGLRGFTLVEMLLALGIIGTLASIIIVAINPTAQLEAAQNAAQKVKAREIQNAIYQYVIEGFSLTGIPTGSWFNAAPICRDDPTSYDNCIDLTFLVTSDILPALPAPDPREPSEDFIGLQIWQGENYQVDPTIFPSESVPVPTITAMTPADDAIDVDDETQISLEFSEPVEAGVGQISVCQVGGVCTPYDAEDTLVSETVAEINHDLVAGKSYYIQIDRNAFHNEDANFLGIYDETTWNFSISSAPPPFSPLDIEDLKLWLDADDASTITIATGISSWVDKSGAGNTVTQATGTNQPAYVAGVLNGKAVVRFNGAATALSNSTPANLDNLTGFTLFIVQMKTVSTNSRDSFAFRFDGTEALRIRANSNGNLTSSLSVGGTSEALSVSGGTNGTYYLTKLTYDGSNIVLDRAGTTDTEPATGNTYNGASNILYIGDNPASLGWSGDIAEVLFYNRSLTPSEKIEISDYLNAKWGF